MICNHNLMWLIICGSLVEMLRVFDVNSRQDVKKPPIVTQRVRGWTSSGGRCPLSDGQEVNKFPESPVQHGTSLASSVCACTYRRSAGSGFQSLRTASWRPMPCLWRMQWVETQRSSMCALRSLTGDDQRLPTLSRPLVYGGGGYASRHWCYPPSMHLVTSTGACRFSLKGARNKWAGRIAFCYNGVIPQHHWHLQHGAPPHAIDS